MKPNETDTPKTGDMTNIGIVALNVHNEYIRYRYLSGIKEKEDVK